MPQEQRRAGTIAVQADGEVLEAKGSFSFGYGQPKREAIIGADGVHGYKEVPQVAFIEGAITDRANLNLEAMFRGRDVLVTLRHASGKMFRLRDAWFAGDGTGSTEEAEIAVRWEAKSGKEIPA